MSWTMSLTGHVEGDKAHRADVEHRMRDAFERFVADLHHLHAGVHAAVFKGELESLEVPRPTAAHGPPDPEHAGKPSA
jgi:hypothetical protein